MNIKNFKKFAKKPCNFHWIKHLQKYIDTRGYVLYNSKMWRDKCAHN